LFLFLLLSSNLAFSGNYSKNLQSNPSVSRENRTVFTDYSKKTHFSTENLSTPSAFHLSCETDSLIKDIFDGNKNRQTGDYEFYHITSSYARNQNMTQLSVNNVSSIPFNQKSQLESQDEKRVLEKLLNICPQNNQNFSKFYNQNNSTIFSVKEDTRELVLQEKEENEKSVGKNSENNTISFQISENEIFSLRKPEKPQQTSRFKEEKILQIKTSFEKEELELEKKGKFVNKMHRKCKSTRNQIILERDFMEDKGTQYLDTTFPNAKNPSLLSESDQDRENSHQIVDALPKLNKRKKSTKNKTRKNKRIQGKQKAIVDYENPDSFIENIDILNNTSYFMKNPRSPEERTTKIINSERGTTGYYSKLKTSYQDVNLLNSSGFHQKTLLQESQYSLPTVTTSVELQMVSNQNELENNLQFSQQEILETIPNYADTALFSPKKIENSNPCINCEFNNDSEIQQMQNIPVTEIQIPFQESGLNYNKKEEKKRKVREKRVLNDTKNEDKIQVHIEKPESTCNNFEQYLCDNNDELWTLSAQIETPTKIRVKRTKHRIEIPHPSPEKQEIQDIPNSNCIDQIPSLQNNSELEPKKPKILETKRRGPSERRRCSKKPVQKCKNAEEPKRRVLRQVKQISINLLEENKADKKPLIESKPRIVIASSQSPSSFLNNKKLGLQMLSPEFRKYLKAGASPSQTEFICSKFTGGFSPTNISGIKGGMLAKGKPNLQNQSKQQQPQQNPSATSSSSSRAAEKNVKKEEEKARGRVKPSTAPTLAEKKTIDQNKALENRMRIEMNKRKLQEKVKKQNEEEKARKKKELEEKKKKKEEKLILDKIKSQIVEQIQGEEEQKESKEELLSDKIKSETEEQITEDKIKSETEEQITEDKIKSEQINEDKIKSETEEKIKSEIEEQIHEEKSEEKLETEIVDKFIAPEDPLPVFQHISKNPGGLSKKEQFLLQLELQEEMKRIEGQKELKQRKIIEERNRIKQEVLEKLFNKKQDGNIPEEVPPQKPPSVELSKKGSEKISEPEHSELMNQLAPFQKREDPTGFSEITKSSAFSLNPMSTDFDQQSKTPMPFKHRAQYKTTDTEQETSFSPLGKFTPFSTNNANPPLEEKKIENFNTDLPSDDFEGSYDPIQEFNQMKIQTTGRKFSSEDTTPCQQQQLQKQGTNNEISATEIDLNFEQNTDLQNLNSNLPPSAYEKEKFLIEKYSPRPHFIPSTATTKAVHNDDFNINSTDFQSNFADNNKEEQRHNFNPEVDSSLNMYQHQESHAIQRNQDFLKEQNKLYFPEEEDDSSPQSKIQPKVKIGDLTEVIEEEYGQPSQITESSEVRETQDDENQVMVFEFNTNQNS
jgi:hypothetical protein